MGRTLMAAKYIEGPGDARAALVGGRRRRRRPRRGRVGAPPATSVRRRPRRVGRGASPRRRGGVAGASAPSSPLWTRGPRRPRSRDRSASLPLASAVASPALLRRRAPPCRPRSRGRARRSRADDLADGRRRALGEVVERVAERLEDAATRPSRRAVGRRPSPASPVEPWKRLVGGLVAGSAAWMSCDRSSGRPPVAVVHRRTNRGHRSSPAEGRATGRSEQRLGVHVHRPRRVEAAVEQRHRIVAAQDDVPAPPVGPARDVGRRRPDDRRRRSPAPSRARAAARPSPSPRARRRPGRQPDGQLHEPAERRRPEPASQRRARRRRTPRASPVAAATIAGWSGW